MTEPRFLTLDELLPKRKADVLEPDDATTLPPVKRARTETPPEYLSLPSIKAFLVKAIKASTIHYAKAVYWEAIPADVVEAIKAWGKASYYLIQMHERTKNVTDGRTGKMESMPCYKFRVMWE